MTHCWEVWSGNRIEAGWADDDAEELVEGDELLLVVLLLGGGEVNVIVVVVGLLLLLVLLPLLLLSVFDWLFELAVLVDGGGVDDVVVVVVVVLLLPFMTVRAELVGLFVVDGVAACKVTTFWLPFGPRVVMTKWLPVSLAAVAVVVVDDTVLGFMCILAGTPPTEPPTVTLALLSVAYVVFEPWVPLFCCYVYI